MEVTRENFAALFPSVKEDIEKCSFIAIDSELTGLRASEEKDNYFDTMEERYGSVRESSKQFLIVQFGLVTFFYQEEEDAFTHRAYNFYTFPSQTKNFMPTLRFMCESSSIEFLSSFGFDFNKLFHHGIPYLSMPKAEKVLSEFEEKEAKYESERLGGGTPNVNVPESFKKFMEETKSVIKRFVASNKKEYVFEDLSPFQRKLIFEHYKPAFPTLLFETVHQEEEESSESDIEDGLKDKKPNQNSTPGKGKDDKTPSKKGTENLPKSMAELSLPPPPAPSTTATTTTATAPSVKKKPYKKPLKIVKASEEEMQKLRDQRKEKMKLDVDSMVGFSKVIQEIGKSGKIVVGHNMLLDISHSVHQFVADLPETLSDFKELVQASFPNLVDTKVMSSQLPFREFFKTSVLTDVLQRLESEPFGLGGCRVEVGGEFSKGYDLAQGKFHEAGYDAYITGLCFISMCNYLGTLQSPQKPRVLPSSPLVMPYINKLFMMRMMDICYMNISGIDLTPSRSHVFYIRCPNTANTDQIRDWFSPFGQIQYQWLNDTEIIVALMDKDQAPLIARNMEHREGFSVLSWEQYLQDKAENGKGRPSASPDSCNSDSPQSAPAKTKRPKTDEAVMKRKTPVKPTVLFETPAWD